jgi:hypothetical protein
MTNRFNKEVAQMMKPNLFRGNSDERMSHVDPRPIWGEGKKPTIVCLCGSTRFIDEFHRMNEKLTMDGYIVLTVGARKESQVAWGPETKDKLDELHKRKIDLADEILVINKSGYIGESTRSEINYATKFGKTIHYLEKPQRYVVEESKVTDMCWQVTDVKGCLIRAICTYKTDAERICDHLNEQHKEGQL